MAEHLNLFDALRACSCMIALVFAGFAGADNLPDPTRPPASLGGKTEGVVQAPADTAPMLQSVLISPTRRVAIINGQAVKQGDMIGESRVVKITEGAVVLRSDTETQTLKLFPGVEKHLSSGRAGAGLGSSGDNKGR